MDIQNKVAIVTGASAGIGLAAARAFAAEGAKVVLAARSAEAIEAEADSLRASGYQAYAVPVDMRSGAEIAQMVQATVAHFGGVDILINNAGQAVVGAIAELDMEAFLSVMQLNVVGPIEAMKAVVPIMRSAGGGMIVNVSSMVSKMALPTLGGYAATKAALNMISDTARTELAPDNIRVLTVLPGMTATEFGKNSVGDVSPFRQRSAGPGPGAGRPSGYAPVIDSAEYVASKIVEAVRNEIENQFMHAAPLAG